MENPTPTCTAFAGQKKIAAGPMFEVAGKVKRYQDKHPDAQILIFDNTSSQQVELDLRGTVDEVLNRIPRSDDVEQEKSGPGRPKLGVVSREIGLLPRHWDWLALQPGGASVALRRLVEEARKQNRSKDAMRQSQNAAYKFMAAMAGDLPHFEEASRAFFARNKSLFETLTAGWPKDIRDHTLKVGELAFHDEKPATP